jgi:hypothetical protein
MENSTGSAGVDLEQTSPPPETPTRRLGSLQRLWAAFLTPREVFTDIAVKPTWVLALVLLVALGVAAQLVVMPHVDTGATLRARLGERAQSLDDQQLERMTEQAQKFAFVGPIMGVIVGPIVWAAMAAVFFLMLKVSGSDTDYMRALSTTLHAYWPPALVSTVLTAVLVQRVGRLPAQQLADVVKSHLGAFLSPDAPAWLRSAATTISVFNVWTVILLIIGFAVVGRISRGRAAVVVLVPWLVWLVGKAGLAAVFG